HQLREVRRERVRDVDRFHALADILRRLDSGGGGIFGAADMSMPVRAVAIPESLHLLTPGKSRNRLIGRTAAPRVSRSPGCSGAARHSGGCMSWWRPSERWSTVWC